MALNPNLYPNGEMPPDPVETAARARGARELASAGIQRAGYDTAAVTSAPQAPSQPLPPHLQNRLAGAGHLGTQLPGHAPPTPAPGASPSISSTPVTDERDYSFADDYSDPSGMTGPSPTETLSPELRQALQGMPSAPDPPPAAAPVSPELEEAMQSLSLSQQDGSVSCPECQTSQSKTHKKCSECGFDLAKLQMGVAQDRADLLLAEDKKNILCPKCSTKQPASNKKCTNCGHDLKDARSAAFAKKAKEGKLSQEQGHAATIFDNSLSLADKRTKDGLVWKAICKTGTLALSPGPGQVDVEKPLELTPDLFRELVLSVEEQAFPYVTVPTTHNNGLLENTGYVRALKTELSQDPKDPEGTEILWAGIQFTEPDIEEKVLRGSIPDTSVGVKFNYRNKRTGKTYPAALEHVALTHQPWVDGLTPFGLSQNPDGVFDQEEENVEFDGVFIHASQAESNPAGDILSKQKGNGGISPTVTPKPRHTRRRPAPTRRSAAQSPEELLAAATVRAEQAEQRAREAELRLSQVEGTTTSLALAAHQGNVDAKVEGWADKPPAIVQRAKEVLLAAGPQPTDVNEDNATLTLSIHVPGETEDEPSKVETRHLSVEGIVDHIMGAVPNFGPGATVQSVMREAELNASQRPTEKTPEEKAKEIMEEAEARAGTGVGGVM